MPNVVTPMSLEDAICWEIGVFVLGIFAFIAAIFFLGMVVAILGSAVFFVCILYYLLKREYGPAIGYFITWLICFLITYGLYNAFGRTHIFEKKLIYKVNLPVYQKYYTQNDCFLPTGGKLLLKMEDGRFCIAESIDDAARGNYQVIDKTSVNQLFEKSMKSLIVANAKSEYGIPIEKEFINCYLSQDLKHLKVIVSRRWRKYPGSERKKHMNFLYWETKDILGHPNPPYGDRTYTVSVFSTNGRLLARAISYPPTILHAVLQMDGQETIWF